jgi:hypothetical protein
MSRDSLHETNPIIYGNMKFTVPIAQTVTITTFWDVTLSSMVGIEDFLNTVQCD